MKKVIFAFNLILLVTLSSLAQEGKFKKDPNAVDQEKPSHEQKKPAQSSGTKADSETDASGSILLQSGTNLDAVLEKTIDVRKSKVGDEIILKTTKSIKQDGDVVVPKGTKLVGRVTEVTRKSGDNKSSSLSLVFESLQNKNLSAPITATVVSIANAKGGVVAGDLFGTEAMGSSSSTGNVSGGGGLLGGATGGVGGVLNSTTQTLGDVTNTAVNTTGGATRTLGGSLSGIQLSQSGNASASGSTTLTAQNKNIRLEKGTQFQIKLDESVRH